MKRSHKLSLLIPALAILIFMVALLLLVWQKSMDKRQDLHLAITNNLVDQLKIMDQDIQKVYQNFAGNTDKIFSDLQVETKYPFFILRKGKLIYWSDYRYQLYSRHLINNQPIQLLSLKNGFFLMTKLTLELEETTYQFASLMPLQVRPPVQNNYLKPYVNTQVFSHEDVKIYHSKSDRKHGVTIQDQYLFSVDFGPEYSLVHPKMNWTIVLLLTLSIIFTVYYLFVWVEVWTKQHPIRALAGLVIGILLVRFSMIYFEFPFALVELDLFNPKLFASSDINPSLGDFMLNTFSGLGVLVYIAWNRSLLNVKFLLDLNKPIKVLIIGLLCALSNLTLFTIFFAIRTVYINSQISLDITSTYSFNELLLSGLLLFTMLSVVYFFIAHYTIKLSVSIVKGATFYPLYGIMLGTILFVIWAWLFVEHPWIVTLINLTYLVLLYFSQLYKHLERISYLTFLYLFVCAFTCAILGAYSIYILEVDRDLDQKNRYATQLFIEDDNLAEYLLMEATKKIEKDLFVKNRMMSPFSSKEVILDKISRIFLSDYFDKFEVGVYLFDSRGQPFGVNDIKADHSSWKKDFMRNKYKTVYDNLYFVNEIDASYLQRYISFIKIKRRGLRVGFIIIDLKLKRFTPNTVYPELLVDNRFLNPYVNSNFSYAIFSDTYSNLLVTSSEGFNYNKDFDPNLFNRPDLFLEGLKFRGYHHLGVRGPSERNIVISSPIQPVSNLVSNFSFMFLTLIFSILIFIIVFALFLGIKQVKINYATKIQLYLNFAFFLPLFVVSIATLSLMSASYQENLNQDYFNKAEGVRRNLTSKIVGYNNNKLSKEDIANEISHMADFSENDINLYSLSGRLVASSQPQIFDNLLLSRFINPRALASIKENKNDRIILEESVGSLHYKSTYIAIKSFETGELLSIIGLPFFESKAVLNKQVISVLTNIINIFTFIFILAIVLSYFASRILTFPLNIITQRIKRISLSGHNEPIEWNSDDEIGLLVGEYNRMLENLEQSKNALAQSEKESAWREMAKQVAHEIKNPLTPMKLSLQHLSRMLRDKNGNKENLSEKPIHTLLNQIETLNDIATSFSTFAQMPEPKNERFELSSELKKTVEFYNNEYGPITTQFPKGNYFINGDKQLMGRIFSNIIINGVEAAKKHAHPKVDVNLVTKDHSSVLIEIKDNGEGIPPSIQEKIFIPNFSTKSTGSGLGLAIAKRGIEHAGGSIWFTTKKNLGTSFFIELPLVD